MSVLPDDLAALYGQPGLSAVVDPPVVEQLELPVEPAATTFRRWLEQQPQPSYITGGA